MQNTRVVLVQAEWVGSREAMAAQYRDLLAGGAAHGADIICLPEFSLIPYFPASRSREGLRWAEPREGGESAAFFAALAREHRAYVIGSLFEQTADGQYFDTATLHAPDGSRVGFTRKVHIPSGEGYHETDFFGGGDAYPVHDLRTIKAAAPTCYDQWFPEMARICALNGAELIYYPTAIGSEPTAPGFDSADAWQTVMRGHAVANGVYIAAANRVGVESPVTFYGSSFICDPMGRVIAQAGRDRPEVIAADLDAGLFTRWRSLFPLLSQRAPHTYTRLTDHD
ncbi:MAG: nitrilase-related carbon-nitrogen hydrolase [bacterium]|nr:nitrilase-related carbon-nitrogen hydrolase [bacterium]